MTFLSLWIMFHRLSNTLACICLSVFSVKTSSRECDVRDKTELTDVDISANYTTTIYSTLIVIIRSPN